MVKKFSVELSGSKCEFKPNNKFKNIRRNLERLNEKAEN